MLTVRCPECGASLKAPPDAVGKRAKCKGCQKSFVVKPEPAVSEPDTLTAGPMTATSVMPAAAPIAATPTTAASGAAAPAVPDFSSFGLGASQPSSATSANPASSSPSTPRRRRRRGGLGVFAWVLIGMVVLAVGMALWHFRSRDEESAPQVVTVPPQVTGELSTLQLKLGTAGKTGAVRYELADAPEGVKISEMGELTWTPTEEQGPGEYEFSVIVRAAGSQRTIATAAVAVTVEERANPPEIEDVDVVEAVPGTLAKVTVKARDTDAPSSPLTFALADQNPPEGAKIDAKTGELTWTPESDDAGQVVNIAVRVLEEGPKKLSADCLVSFRVAAGDSPIERLAARFREKGGDVGMSSGKDDPDVTGEPHLFHFGADDLLVFAFDSAKEAEAAAESLKQPEKGDAVAKRLKRSIRVYRADEFIAIYPGEQESTLTVLESVLGKPTSEAKFAAEETTTKSERDPSDEALIALYNDKDKRLKPPAPKIVSPQEFPALRKIFAERFEKEHEADLRRAFGDEYDDMRKWLNERAEFKESLFLAFDPQHDDIGAGLALVKVLRKEFPKQIDKYLSLVVATAVVWDREGQGIYDYAHHARRTGSKMPDGLLAAVDNFKYLVETEEQMQGRIRYVPWEFLTHVVNHRTPLPERQWTLANYLARRPMFGKTYSDVPYDTEMLRTNSQVCKLGGKDYTLPNILQFGGVCAMQADFAARVGKGLGVPSEYVRGASASGDLHAWIMWVEITAATPANVSFSLESHGRYLGDHYYVGQLNDPQTGVEMTDRDLERRLHSVGTNAFAKRQADLAMKAFPMLRDELDLDRNDQLAFLGQVTRLCPWNEAAWAEAAKLAGDRELDKRGRTQMLATLNQLFTTFAHLPDFTLSVFPDLVQFEPDVKTRIKHYYKLLDVYAAAKRPDLAFDGLLVLSDILVENDRSLEAIQALAATIKKYADQGHYVPRMLDRLELLCDKPEHKAALVAFYSEFLPLIPQKRGNESSKYCMTMYERGIRKFTEAGNTQQAQLYQGQLQKLRAGN